MRFNIADFLYNELQRPQYKALTAAKWDIIIIMLGTCVKSSHWDVIECGAVRVRERERSGTSSSSCSVHRLNLHHLDAAPFRNCTIHGMAGRKNPANLFYLPKNNKKRKGNGYGIRLIRSALSHNRLIITDTAPTTLTTITAPYSMTSPGTNDAKDPGDGGPNNWLHNCGGPTGTTLTGT